MRRAAHALYRVNTGDSRGAIMMTSTHHDRAGKHGRHRRRPDGAFGGIPSRPARCPVRHSRRECADRRHVASAMGLAAALHAGEVRRARRPAVSCAAEFLSHQGRDGRLPRAVRSDVRAACSVRRSCHAPFAPGRSAGRGCRRSALRSAERGRGHDELSAAAHSVFRC